MLLASYWTKPRQIALDSQSFHKMRFALVQVELYDIAVGVQPERSWPLTLHPRRSDMPWFHLLGLRCHKDGGNCYVSLFMRRDTN